MIQDPATPEADVEHVAQPAESPAAPVLEHVTGGRLPCCLQQTSVGDPWTLTGLFQTAVPVQQRGQNKLSREVPSCDFELPYVNTHHVQSPLIYVVVLMRNGKRVPTYAKRFRFAVGGKNVINVLVSLELT